MFNVFGFCYIRHLYKIKKYLRTIKATVENNSQMYRTEIAYIVVAFKEGWIHRNYWIF